LKAETEMLVKAKGKEAVLKARTKTWFKEEKRKMLFGKLKLETFYIAEGLF
jgi:hypothetical protein